MVADNFGRTLTYLMEILCYFMHTNTLVNKFCNLLMRSGNKSRALALFSQGFAAFLKFNTFYSSLPSATGRPGPTNSTSKKPSHTDGQKYVQVRNPVFSELCAPVSCAQVKSSNGLLVGSTSNLGQAAQATGSGSGFEKPSPQTKTNLPSPESLLETLIENVRPCIEVRKVRVARATYQVPAQISKSKGQTLALRWIIEFAHKRRQKDKISFAQALAEELHSAYKKQGGPRQRRGELHRLAEANRSCIRYRWW